MDKTVLVDKTIKEGEKLIEVLDNTQFDVRAAMWFYSTENDEWRFIVASPFVDLNGPKKTYEFIQKELKNLPEDFGIPLKSITVLSPQNELIRLIRIAIRTNKGISGIRFTKNVINSVFVEDVYIYRIL
jgi:hypothetical protein